MHHRHKDPDAPRDTGHSRARGNDESRGSGERSELAAENRGEPYYNEPGAGRFGEPRGRGYSNAIERGADHASASGADEREPWYPRGARPTRESDYGHSEYGAFGRYGDYRGGRWTASPELPQHVTPGRPMEGYDPSQQSGAYYYGPRSDEDRRDYRYRADDDRYDPYGRDLGANWTRPGPYSGYAETQGHSARGAESYRGRGPKGYARSDARILEDVSERLTDDARVDASDVTVTAKSGIVTLDGTVPRRWMKHCAEDVAESCGGVKDVVNRLSVRRDDDGANVPARSTDDSGKKH